MKVLMCNPQHFDVNYEINVWMDKQKTVDREKTINQYQNLKDTYKKLGVEVKEIEQAEGLPDMVYAANYGFLHNNIFVRSNFFHQERRKEAELAAEFMAKLGYEVVPLAEELYFEGQGDLFRCNDQFFCGYGFRTKLETIKELEKIFSEPVHALKLVDPRWYHLDTCFLPLGNKRVMIAPEAFDQESLQIIKNNFDLVIETNDPTDIAGFACNSMVIGDKVITYRMSENTKKTLSELGFEVIEVDMSEFMKGGGSVRCLTMDL